MDRACDDIERAVRAESICRHIYSTAGRRARRFIGPFVATIGWVISSVIRAHHADTAFDDFSSLPVAVLLLVLVVVAIASVQIRSLSNIVALAATDDVAWLQNAMGKGSRERRSPASLMHDCRSNVSKPGERI